MWSVSDEERESLEASWLAFGIQHGRMEPVSSWWREIAARHAEPHRHYHTLGHVRDVLQLVSGPAAVAAAWFHDIVCDPTRPDSEDASARVAASALREVGFSVAAIDVVAQMIRATATHEPNGLPQQALLFLDADLATLGSSRERYIEYLDALRREHGFLPDDEFAARRRENIERYLTRPRIYFTELMRDRYEGQARENLSWEAGQLGIWEGRTEGSSAQVQAPLIRPPGTFSPHAGRRAT